MFGVIDNNWNQLMTMTVIDWPLVFYASNLMRTMLLLKGLWVFNYRACIVVKNSTGVVKLVN